MNTFNSKNYTDAPKQIEKSFFIDAPIEEVWNIVANHKGMTAWVPMIKHVELVSNGENGDWGAGCERHCQFGPDLLKEKIVYWNAPYGYAYSIADMHLVRDHVGYIELTKEKNGTRVTWQQFFIPNGNFVKNFLAQNIMLPYVMTKAMKNLNKKIRA